MERGQLAGKIFKILANGTTGLSLEKRIRWFDSENPYLSDIYATE